MKELKEISSNYAMERSNDLFSQVVAKAYADGYRQGYKDREDEIPVDLRDRKTEFVDLGLPSGTMWAAGYETDKNGELLFLTYEKATAYSIPTEEQWKELLDYCRFDFHYSSSGFSFYGVTCIGPNGKTIKFRSEGYIVDAKLVHKNVSYGGGGSVYFWICNKGNGVEKEAVVISSGTNSIKNFGLANVFSGYKLPIRLVKTK